MFPLPAFLLTMWQNRKKSFKIIGIILLLVAIIGVGAFCTYVWMDLAKAKADLVQAEKDLAEKQTQLDDLQKSANAVINDLAIMNKKNADRIKAARVREREIRNVPKDQDGAVAPVLRDSLNRMR